MGTVIETLKVFPHSTVFTRRPSAKTAPELDHSPQSPVAKRGFCFLRLAIGANQQLTALT